MRAFFDTNVVVACAVKADVERLYSWNGRHLQTVAPEYFRSRITVP